jgi:hypothetical protein
VYFDLLRAAAASDNDLCHFLLLFCFCFYDGARRRFVLGGHQKY